MDLDLTALPMLAGLALADALSLGALAIPVWLLIAPRLRAGRVLLYLAALGLFYFGVGVLALLGLRPLLSAFEVNTNDPLVLRMGFGLGVALLVASFLMDSKKARERRESSGGSGRLLRWRERAVGNEKPADGTRAVTTGVTSVLGLALAAGVAEVATMVPYIAAVGIITTSGIPVGTALALLAGYCVVMLLPASVLLLLRTVGGRTVDGMLQRIDAWFARNATSALSWLIGIVGVILIVRTVRVVMPGAGIVGLG